jgi:KDO2-lipid IV(A) lauroyltransferase
LNSLARKETFFPSATAVAAATPVTAPARRASPLALDGLFWRRVAQRLACHGPSWFVRWAPPIIGASIALLFPASRRVISKHLARARGPVGGWRNVLDVCATFANFASCLTDVLAGGSKNASPPDASILGHPDVDTLLASHGGIIFATAHTAGWESLGALLIRQHRKRVMIVMRRERHEGARRLQDSIREAHSGVQIVHVDGDPLASLPLVRHLRDGGVVALQIDRVPYGMSGRAVSLFGQPGAVPEGPLRLAQLTGAPVVPVFSARTGHRRYEVHLQRPIVVSRRATAAALDAAAQQIADDLSAFVSARPTQWFAFGE